jgi:hypothetical protein
VHQRAAESSPQPTVPPPYELAWESALRGLSQQESSLDNLRSRAGTLIAAIAISTSFLGDLALTGDERLNWLTGGALVSFAIAMGLCLWVLLPRHGKWLFRLDPATLVDRIDAQQTIDKANWHRALAKDIGQGITTNDERLDSLHLWYSIAIGFVAVELGLFLIDYARG